MLSEGCFLCVYSCLGSPEIQAAALRAAMSVNMGAQEVRRPTRVSEAVRRTMADTRKNIYKIIAALQARNAKMPK
jgi:hypothetical protein